jgi:hypothetical protein
MRDKINSWTTQIDRLHSLSMGPSPTHQIWAVQLFAHSLTGDSHETGSCQLACLLQVFSFGLPGVVYIRFAVCVGRRMRFWQSSSLHIWTQLHYVLIEYCPSVWIANIRKMVIKQLTCDLTLSKLTCTAHGNNLFHWTLRNLRSPTSINETITYVYILKAKNSTPNLTSHRHPQVKLIARVSPAHHVSVWTQDLFVLPGTRKGSVPVNGHHPAPNPFLHTAWNTPKKSAQPQVV